MTREKLVRDGVPALLWGLGVDARFRSVDAGERRAWLLAKLKEECDEVLAAPSVEELADVAEVLHALASELGVAWSEVEAVRERKGADRGVFDAGVVMRLSE
ncbi:MULTISPECIES: nucleoside triphosphate pyrophosphohydrolase [unclassified Rathayibacter]|uniref:nucleoside triphosphate pyrophosphohydrolase n=1 Tax=unclassified Rathayibacter TaxID=2609250 RepID=UPI000CE776E6|nr:MULTISPECIES: nucleoside triphosphate pyrophosphohydrolase [unclassified Rathayibacter]PPF28151.1 hypothetical protein C5C54_07725 [Rathayibacter sp. AY1F2]PPF55246.1 hypothetical protein C5C55_10410 [Rathayibacter sp. AY1C2]PPF71812.1 hypothetical protein C5C46_09145 [Rathayibacter sp. AY1E6]PPG55374.1 hypothetical protein C5C41_02010 [Rathayibacter sp. AY1E9]PPG57461.1 hypothetical protein C5C69_14325 [Rathayibacter sp. AY1C7]